MQYRKLGRTDIDVSVICLGTMTWGRQNTESDAFAQMDYALTQGVNFFDTAEMYAIPPSAESYGRTETIIGNWLANRKCRDKVVLATKVAGPGLNWVRDSNARLDRPNILAAADDSLKRLKTDYIDLYQLHWPNRANYHFGRHWNFYPEQADAAEEQEGFLEILHALDELVRAGKVRHIGLSNESAWGVMSYLRIAGEKALPRVVSVQNEYSLLCRLFEPDLAEIAIHERVGLLAWSPLAAGALSGKYLDGKIPEGSRRSLLNEPPHRATGQADDAIRAYKMVAEKHGLDVCQMALAFVNRQPFVTANIIGATTMDQLRANIASIDLDLGEEVLRDIEIAYKDHPVPY